MIRTIAVVAAATAYAALAPAASAQATETPVYAPTGTVRQAACTTADSSAVVVRLDNRDSNALVTFEVVTKAGGNTTMRYYDVPADEVKALTYRVQTGETFRGIVRAFDAEVTDRTITGRYCAHTAGLGKVGSFAAPVKITNRTDRAARYVVETDTESDGARATIVRVPAESTRSVQVGVTPVEATRVHVTRGDRTLLRRAVYGYLAE